MTLHYVARFHGTGSTDEDCLGLMWTGTQGTGDANATRVIFRYDSNANQLETFIRDSGDTTNVNMNAAVSIEDSQFHGLTMHWDGANINNYVDGVSVGTPVAHADTLHNSATAKNPEIIGGHFVTGATTTDGPRFDVKMWAFWIPALPTPVVPTLWHAQTRWDLFKPARRNYFAPTPAPPGTISHYAYPHRMFG